jgi:alanine racemase
MDEMDGVITWAEIDLEAIRFNIRAYQRHVGPGVGVFAVVKANAYGHGAVPVARAALEAGAAMLAVHRLNEGVELRQAGIDAPVLLMGYTPPGGAEQVVRWRLTPSLMTAEFAQALSAQAGLAGWTAPVHVKIDTGMSRYGLMPDEALDFLQYLITLPNLRLEGMFTHFATADSLDQTWMRRQLETFNGVVAAVRAAGIEIPLLHAANSAAAMRLRESHFQAIRPGIAIYGLDPSSEWPPVFEIRPALALKSLVARVRELPVGAGVSYGRTWVAARPTTAALVPVGYGDGYHRILSNRGVVLVGGHRAPVIGRVCMDQIVVDVTGIPGVKQDDEVVLVGRQGGEQIRAEEVARLAGTINYEVTTAILPRAVRVYK